MVRERMTKGGWRMIANVTAASSYVEELPSRDFEAKALSGH